jgi:hypothetical protein
MEVRALVTGLFRANMAAGTTAGATCLPKLAARDGLHALAGLGVAPNAMMAKAAAIANFMTFSFVENFGCSASPGSDAATRAGLEDDSKARAFSDLIESVKQLGKRSSSLFWRASLSDG